MMHGKAHGKLGIAEISKASRVLPLDPTNGAYLEPPAARVNVLMHIRFWPTNIKLNPS